MDYRFLTNPDEARSALDALAGEEVVGLDTETYWDWPEKNARVSLVQMASRGGTVIVVDVLAVGVDLLKPLVESPGVRMTAHNARFDEAVLQGAGMQPVGFVDTLRLARAALSLPSYTLAAVVAHLFGIALDKSFQKSNWRRRPLSRSQIEYAATDAVMTLRVYDELCRILGEQGRLDAALQAATLVPTTERPVKKKRLPTPDLSPPLTVEEKRVVSLLKKWRLERANAQNVPTYMICPDRTLEHLARTRPATPDELQNIHGLGESKIARFGEDLLNALRSAFE